MDKTVRAELDKLHGDIITALYIDGDRSSDVTESVRAYDSGNVALLRLFQRFLPDRSIQFSNVRDLYAVLKDQGVANAEQQVTAERVQALVGLWMKIMDLMKATPEIHATERLAFVVMADVSDRVLAERIMIDRWPGSVQQAKALLNEMKKSSRPLAQGSL